MTLIVTTNNVPRFIIDDHELSASERAEFNYIDWNALVLRREVGPFFRYRGQLYDLGDMPRVESGGELESLGWHGFASDTYFSGIAVKYCDDHESIIVARVYWKD